MDREKFLEEDGEAKARLAQPKGIGGVKTTRRFAADLYRNLVTSVRKRLEREEGAPGRGVGCGHSSSQPELLLWRTFLRVQAQCRDASCGVVSELNEVFLEDSPSAVVVSDSTPEGPGPRTGSHESFQ